MGETFIINPRLLYCERGFLIKQEKMKASIIIDRNEFESEQDFEHLVSKFLFRCGRPEDAKDNDLLSVKTTISFDFETEDVQF